LNNAPPKKTAAQQAWRRLRDRDIAAVLSDRRRRAARDVTTQPHELRAGCVLSAGTTPDTVHVAALGMKE